MSSGVNGAIHVKWSESQYRWSKSHQVFYSLVKSNIVFLSHVYSRRIYRVSLHMSHGAKPEIEGLRNNIDGVKCQVVEYFVV